MQEEYLPIPIMRIPGNSFIHRLHPITKLIWAVGVVVFAFSTRNPALLGIVFLLGLSLFWISKTWSALKRIFAVLFPISLSLVVFQALAPAFPRPWTPIASLGPFTIYNEGIYSGLSMITRAWAASNFALVLVATTHPSDLFVALQKLGSPYELNFMVAAALQLIPIVQREFLTVVSAQRSRGMKASGFGAVIPSFVPVFAGTVERVQQLAMSLESRAFGSSGAKTNLRQVQASLKDYIVGALGVILPAVSIPLIIHYRRSLDWSEISFLPTPVVVFLVVFCALTFVGVVAVLLWRARPT